MIARQKPVWTGNVHVAQTKHPHFLDGYLGAYVNVVALVKDEGEFKEIVQKQLESEGLQVLEWDGIEDFEDCKRRAKDWGQAIGDSIYEAVARLSEQNPVDYGIFDAYERDE